jgi:hypothetical protein
MEKMCPIFFGGVAGWTLGFVVRFIHSHSLANRKIVVDEFYNEGSGFLRVGYGTAKAGPIYGMEDVISPSLLVLNVLTNSPCAINISQKLSHSPSNSTSWQKGFVGPIESPDRKDGVGMKIGL